MVLKKYIVILSKTYEVEAESEEDANEQAESNLQSDIDDEVFGLFAVLDHEIKES